MKLGGLLRLLLILLGFVLTIWGSVSRMQKKAKEDKCIALSNWMITDGLSLLTIAVFWWLLQQRHPDGQRQQRGRSIIPLEAEPTASVRKAFCLGLGLLLAVLLWLALCITGTYLSLTAIQSGRHLVVTEESKSWQCGQASIVASATAVGLNWIIFLVWSVERIRTFISNSKNQSEHLNHQSKQETVLLEPMTRPV